MQNEVEIGGAISILKGWIKVGWKQADVLRAIAGCQRAYCIY